MAWIEVHQALPTHKKTIRLTRILKIRKPEALGYLLLLWLWALDNTQDGYLDGLEAQDIAGICEWKGKNVAAFTDGLIDAGFLESTERGLCIHDWDDYCGKLMAMRAGNRERQKRYRDKRVTGQKKKTETKDTGQLNNDTVTVTCPQRNGATVPNRTVPIVSPVGDTISAESVTASTPEAVVTLPLNTGGEFSVVSTQVEEWQKLYPAVDVLQELRAMRGWCLANPSKRKTKAGIVRFINGWLAREQDKGGSQKGYAQKSTRPAQSDPARVQAGTSALGQMERDAIARMLQSHSEENHET